MEIRTLALGLIQINCYLVSTDNAALVIDPGFSSPEAESFLLENCEKERVILITHAHFDHIGGAKELREKTGVKIAVGERDDQDLRNPEANLSNKFHARVEPFSADILLSDGEILKVGDIDIKVISTPGHTVGGVCFLVGDVLFSGDTLFCESVGRTDFKGGDFAALMESVGRLMQLDPKLRVLPGHGPATTVAHEKQYNPIISLGRKNNL